MDLEKIFRQLERVNPRVARSLEEWLEETLTVHRLGVGGLLRRTLTSINPIESCLSTIERVAHNMKRWREGEQALRWTATGLPKAHKKFRRVKGYRELELLHRRVNSSLPAHGRQDLPNRRRSRNVQQVESRHFQLNRGQFPSEP